MAPLFLALTHLPLVSVRQQAHSVSFACADDRPQRYFCRPRKSAMSPEQILHFAFEYARDEYARSASRLALIETKLQLTAAVAGIVLAGLAGLWPDWIPHESIASVLLLAGALISILISLYASVIGSVLSDAETPETAEEVAKRCEDYLTKEVQGLDVSKALWGEASVSFRGATQSVQHITDDRLKKLKLAQVTLITGLILLAVLLFVPWLAVVVGSLNSKG